MEFTKKKEKKEEKLKIREYPLMTSFWKRSDKRRKTGEKFHKKKKEEEANGFLKIPF